jgi:hypothetical protein
MKSIAYTFSGSAVQQKSEWSTNGRTLVLYIFMVITGWQTCEFSYNFKVHTWKNVINRAIWLIRFPNQIQKSVKFTLNSHGKYRCTWCQKLDECITNNIWKAHVTTQRPLVYAAAANYRKHVQILDRCFSSWDVKLHEELKYCLTCKS